jgi:hypothetical protein
MAEGRIFPKWLFEECLRKVSGLLVMKPVLDTSLPTMAPSMKPEMCPQWEGHFLLAHLGVSLDEGLCSTGDLTEVTWAPFIYVFVYYRTRLLRLLSCDSVK